MCLRTCYAVPAKKAKQANIAQGHWGEPQQAGESLCVAYSQQSHRRSWCYLPARRNSIADAFKAALQVASGDCPHTLFYGPPGAGKKTLILAFLREVYGAGADKVQLKNSCNTGYLQVLTCCAFAGQG